MHHPTGKNKVLRWGRFNLRFLDVFVLRGGGARSLPWNCKLKLCKLRARPPSRASPTGAAQGMAFLTEPAINAAWNLLVAISKGRARCVACGSLLSGCDEEEKSKIPSFLGEFMLAGHRLLSTLIGQLQGPLSSSSARSSSARTVRAAEGHDLRVKEHY